MLTDYLLETLDRLHILALNIVPELLCFFGRLSLGVSDVLVITPDRIQSNAQRMDEVAIVVADTSGLADMPCRPACYPPQ